AQPAASRSTNASASAQRPAAAAWARSWRSAGANPGSSSSDWRWHSAARAASPPAPPRAPPPRDRRRGRLARRRPPPGPPGGGARARGRREVALVGRDQLLPLAAQEVVLFQGVEGDAVARVGFKALAQADEVRSQGRSIFRAQGMRNCRSYRPAGLLP